MDKLHQKLETMLLDLDVHVDYLQHPIEIGEIPLDQDHMPLLYRHAFVSSVLTTQKMFL